jgi:lipopolysaccharide O-acetyltransferase
MVPSDRPKRIPYGPIQMVWLGICLILTKLFFRPCRLIRFPIFVRNKSRIRFGRRFVSGYLVRLDALGGKDCLEFGDNVQINDHVHIGALEKVRIGNDVLIASRVFITDHDHGAYGGGDRSASSPLQAPVDRIHASRPVDIGDRVWIGENVSILSGVTIGSGSVIGAGAVVCADIPPNCIAVGVPARIIRTYDFSTQCWIPVHNPGSSSPR